MGLMYLQQAKDQIKFTTDEDDEAIQLKIDHASAIIVDYLKGRADVGWTESNVPYPVQAAAMLMLGHLYAHRGDDAAGTFRTPASGVWEDVERLLVRYRDPALA